MKCAASAWRRIMSTGEKVTVKSTPISKTRRGMPGSRKTALASIVASCMAFAAAAHAADVSRTTLPAGANHLLSTNLPEAVASGQALRIGAMEQARSLKLALVLPLRNEAELDVLLQQLQDPRSPNYHRYLEVDEFTSRFSATPEQYAAVIAWAKHNGLAVTQTAANRHVVDIEGTVGAINQALHVQIGTYQLPASVRAFFAPDREPTTDLGVPLLDIKGLTNINPRRNHLVRGTDQQHLDAITRAHGSGPSGEYLPSDMRAAYYGSGSLKGTGQTVGIFSYDGYKSADVTLFYTRTGMTSSVPIKNVLVAGYSGVCDNGDGSGTSACDDGEQVLDIVNVIGMAPGLKGVTFYEGALATDILNSMATSNTAKVISCSLGGGDFGKSDDTIYKQMAAQGQTFLNATGDNGAYNSQTWAAPSLDVNILDVGGTDLTTSGPGGTWTKETGWTGSSGGFYKPASQAIPAWQKLAGVITTTNKGSKTYRNDPDVSAEANYDNPTVSNGKFLTGYGGTSFAAPRWAGFLALANQQSVAAGKSTVGFVNPKIYNLGLGSGYHSQFHDITIGNNKPDLGTGAGFNAGANFDLVTGWGSPDGAALVNALAQ